MFALDKLHTFEWIQCFILVIFDGFDDPSVNCPNKFPSDDESPMFFHPEEWSKFVGAKL